VATFADPDSAVCAARAFVEDMQGSGIAIRAGLHVGRYEAREDGDIAGIAVNIAARVEAEAGPGEIAVTQAMHDTLLGSGNVFTDFGEHELKGLKGTWRLFLLA
jgi:class 3 adenylate cyclase